MIVKTFKKIFGSRNDRELKRMSKTVAKVSALEEEFRALSDAELLAKTAEFKLAVSNGKSIDKLIPEAFATVREAGARSLGMRHFDVQLLGGIALHEGRIAEMRTGEGKTLVATLPAYLNALAGQGVHIVTVNDYLAERDANWMRPLYEFLGLTVGIIQSGQMAEDKRAAYAADITYGTNNEFGFDYLRDNTAFSLEDRVSRGTYFAIVDEVDSILIDEARTPLIISGPTEDSSALYKRMKAIAPRLQRASDPESTIEQDPQLADDGHFIIDEKQRSVDLTELGHEFVEEILIEEKLLDEGDSLYSTGNLNLLHHVTTALRALHLFQRNVEYIVQNDNVVLIDEHTGRTMLGRRLSDGLHQALEAKEGVNIQAESQTLASTTFQNYFRLYQKLAGMTGTADTEAPEFHQIYSLDVIVIPTNKQTIRQDLNDLIFMSVDEKYAAVVDDIKETLATGAPILVGTASIETSEQLSKFLNKAKIEHNVLNAKFHKSEAKIIAEAGRPGALTIATNMAGRGTDIVLGGNLEAELIALDTDDESKIAAHKEGWQLRQKQVLAAGGLHIFGTERHESRRIDNQLRGRSGRQGDPGVTRFYLSMDDSLMRIFASDGVRNFMQRLGMEQGEAIEHKMVSNAIEKAQRKVEGRNFDIRKQLLEYDDVANDQRQIIYQQRNDILLADDISNMVNTIRHDVINDHVDGFIPPQSIEDQWDVEGLMSSLKSSFDIDLPIKQWLDDDDELYEESLRQKIIQQLADKYHDKAARFGDAARRFEKQIMLQILDGLWKEHLATMDHLRQGIGLRGYAGRNPKQEYKREAFELFQSMLQNMKFELIRFLSLVQVQAEDDPDIIEKQRREAQAKESITAKHEQAQSLANDEAGSVEGQVTQPVQRQGPKVGRNEKCPCGSGKKYKQCCGKIS
ncbi:MAG: preprotein translocase subunit SecA [Cellvibrionales bacterium]|nr:preprotein translocase subunit SecA [Cellvibrionales bacterium]|tara:strand:+ start:16827 stop:19565 length:2739 start_codon:yes stop_codon:yes gene_type:complete